MLETVEQLKFDYDRGVMCMEEIERENAL